MAGPSPVHLHWRYIGLVFVGGAIGTAVRALIAAAVPPVAGIPVATFGINVVGAFVLGMLLQSLALRGDDTGWRRDVRLFAGTGILGGFTTYSAFAVDADGLIVAQNLGGSILYAVATIVVGALGTLAGIAVASRIGRSAR
ncbi:fluoride efflux transporter FluC [Leifsonia poae]|uniref:Fluoride-specific ion channel FluC n=1 Tax=Leifsonia poae TaxID=110933 RepID=A0A9W6H993_9MICO|nr:CrcB family protein [Leifsonia poae]GLJ75925.1 hypothetical protein GCM10017584_14990 [Leifsonia poae]